MDAGLSDKREGLLAFGWERAMKKNPLKIGLQAGILRSFGSEGEFNPYVGGPVRF